MKVQLILWRTTKSSFARTRIESAAPRTQVSTLHPKVFALQTHDSGEQRRGLDLAKGNFAQDFRDCHCPRSEEDPPLAMCIALFDWLERQFL